MGQITREFIALMLEHGRRNEHSPLTIHEEQQLARAWARSDMSDELAECLRECVPLLEAQLHSIRKALGGRYRTPALEKAYVLLNEYDALKEW